MTGALAFLGPFGDAVDFVLHEREGPGGAQVGGGQLHPAAVKQLELAGAAIAVAIVVGLPIGAVARPHRPRLVRRGRPSRTSAARCRRIGLVFLFFAVLGAGFLNIMLALVLLAIPPILTNAYIGVREVEADVVDAARGIGMTGARDRARGSSSRSRCRSSSPASGPRRSTSSRRRPWGPQGGVVTLGDPIINPTAYGGSGRLGAALLVAILAVAAEVGLGAVERAVTPKGTQTRRRDAGGCSSPDCRTAKRRAQPT